MAEKTKTKPFQGMMRVGEAADFIGVSAETMRNWDRSGRLSSQRNPVTGYRYYERRELEQFLAKAINEREALS